MPQLEDGYTRIANELLEALVSNRIAGEQMQCFLFILRKTYGFKKKVDMIALSQFVTATGMKKPAVCRALSSLENRNIIVIKKDNSNMTSYSINKAYAEWVALSKKITLSKKIIAVDKKDNQPLSIMRHTKDTLTKDTLTKEMPNKFIPPNLNEWQDFYYEYACKFWDYPISRKKSDALSQNSHEYWEDKKWNKVKDWKRTAQTSVRSKGEKLKDWAEAKNEGVKSFG